MRQFRFKCVLFSNFHFSIFNFQLSTFQCSSFGTLKVEPRTDPFITTLQMSCFLQFFFFLSSTVSVSLIFCSIFNVLLSVLRCITKYDTPVDIGDGGRRRARSILRSAEHPQAVAARSQPAFSRRLRRSVPTPYRHTQQSTSSMPHP